MTISRDSSIDILRSFALIGMIVAHCNPSPLIMQLRGFDVPLIVFLSGVSYLMSASKGSQVRYLSYCWKRVKRLVFPAWIFLCVYYTILFTGLGITGNLSINWDEVLHNFTFTTGWYVWIIRVFLLIALVAPPVYFVTKRMSVTTFMLLFLLLLIGYEFVAKINTSDWYYYLTMTIPYILMFAFGTMNDKMNKKHYFIIALVSMAIFICYTLYYIKTTGEFQTTQICKYPPLLYYTSYAIAITSLLWIFRNPIKNTCGIIRLERILSFIGSHTLWIYFWHIIYLLIIGNRIGNSFILFCCVLILAVLTDYLQVLIIKWLVKKYDNAKFDKNMTILFLG